MKVQHTGGAHVHLRAIALAFVAALALFAGSLVGVAHAEQYQGWETDNTHIHLNTTSSMFQAYGSPTTVQATVLLHNSLAHVKTVRWSCESSVKQSVAVSFQGDGSAVQTFPAVTLTINPSLCPKGWQEIRYTADTTLSNGTREFTTSRECANFTVGNGTSQNYCGGPTVAGRCGGGAWYQTSTAVTTPGYLIGFVDCRDWSQAQNAGFHAGDKIRVRTQNVGGGIATFDPDFHNGNIGISPQATPPNNVWTTVTIPALAPGQHTLHLRDRASGFSGAVVMPLKIV